MYFLKELQDEEFITKEMSNDLNSLMTKFWNYIVQAKENKHDIDIKVVDEKGVVIDYYCYVAPRERSNYGIYIAEAR